MEKLTKFERCKKDVKRKIMSGKISKTFKCDAKGKPNKRGRNRCKTNEFALCSRLR